MRRCVTWDSWKFIKNTYTWSFRRFDPPSEVGAWPISHSTLSLSLTIYIMLSQDLKKISVSRDSLWVEFLKKVRYLGFFCFQRMNVMFWNGFLSEISCLSFFPLSYTQQQEAAAADKYLHVLFWWWWWWDLKWDINFFNGTFDEEREGERGEQWERKDHTAVQYLERRFCNCEESQEQSSFSFCYVVK